MKQSAYTGKGVGVALLQILYHTGNYLTMIMVMERVWRGS